MKYFTKYLTSAPIMAAATLVALSVVLIELNHVFPGLHMVLTFMACPKSAACR